jgi:maltokinase
VTQRTDRFVSEQLNRALAVWLPRQRWFAGSGRTIDRLEIVQARPLLDALASGGPQGLTAVVRVTFTGGTRECYQVPIGIRRELPRGLDPAVIAGSDDMVCYDALGDAELVAELLKPHRGGPSTPVRSRIIGSEQSNTSVVIDERFVLKVFRRLEPGLNPELELGRALARAGSRQVASLLGAIEGELAGEPVTFATLHRYVVGAEDGWTLALDSIRDRSAASEGFAPRARRLGAALAQVHADLARELGADRMDAIACRDLSATLVDKLDAVLPIVPGLVRHERALRAAFSSIGRMRPGAPVQRLHGDLHLGQTLRAAGEWLLIDFEGEPAVPLAQRRARQSPLRDVAGMLRSFDYAVRFNARSRPGAWAARSQAAFCAGYAEVAGEDPRAHHELLRVLQLEKAIYEAAYEARFRPDWVDIPLRAIRQLV